MTTPSALPPEQRRAILQQRIAQRKAQWYEQHLLRLEAQEATGGVHKVAHDKVKDHQAVLGAWLAQRYKANSGL